jgi:MoxR-like ATPase
MINRPDGMSGAEARAILRSALRAHPNAEALIRVARASARRVNELTMDELLAALGHGALDAQHILDTHAALDAGDRARAAAILAQHEQPEAPELAPEPDATTPDPVDAELQSIRGLVVSGGFTALDARLRDLIIAANKPPVTIEVQAPAPTAPGAVPHPKQTGATDTWGRLFDVVGPLASRTIHLWDGAHPDVPKANPHYLWPMPQTMVALTQLARGRNVFMFGPAGTGKTEFASQFASRTGRPFALLSCDSGTDAATLVGMTVPAADGGVTWQDGQLTRAIQIPGCVVCIDEPSVARPGALFVLQNVLANRVLFIAETGRRVPVAPGVVFVSADNTAGLGGGARRGFTDTNRLNSAFLDRFGARVRFKHLPADQEARTLATYTGCTLELAALLVAAATTTRAAADAQDLTEGVGFRRLIAWSELLTDGLDAETAFVSAVLDAAPESDHETLRQQCALSIDGATVAAALAGQTVITHN